MHPPTALSEGTLVDRPVTAARSLEDLRLVGTASVRIPEGFTIHDRLKRTFVDVRLSKLNSGAQEKYQCVNLHFSYSSPLDPHSSEIDWATAEALAFGTLLLEGYNVRLSGQDAARGTFSQRHMRFVDQSVDGRSFIPLNSIEPGRP